MKRGSNHNFKIRTEIASLKPYIPGKPIDEVKRELGIDNIIKLASNELPFGPTEAVKEAILEAANEIHRYPDSNNYYLKKAISKKDAVPEEHIVFGNGSSELFKLIADCILTEGDSVVYADPSFVMYTIVTAAKGARSIKVPLKEDDLSHDMDAMLSKVDESTSMVIICNPNNPTGTITNKVYIESFLENLPYRIFVLFDEAYDEFTRTSEYKSGLEYFLEGWPNIGVIRSFSKAYGIAGLRIGYGYLPLELAKAVDKVREPFNINLMAQKAALAAISSEEDYKILRDAVVEERERLEKALTEKGYKVFKSQANFIFFDAGVDSDELFKALLKKGIIVRTGSIFGEKYRTFIRLTIGTKQENEVFLDAFFKVIKDFKGE